MYAVISDRGRQIGVREGDTILCDLSDSWETGQEVLFDQVLLLSHEGGVRVGKPTVAGASVKAEVLGVVKDEKLVVFQYKRRKNSRSKRGHRQRHSRLRVTSIQG